MRWTLLWFWLDGGHSGRPVPWSCVTFSRSGSARGRQGREWGFWGCSFCGVMLISRPGSWSRGRVPGWRRPCRSVTRLCAIVIKARWRGSWPLWAGASCIRLWVSGRSGRCRRVGRWLRTGCGAGSVVSLPRAGTGRSGCLQLVWGWWSSRFSWWWSLSLSRCLRSRFAASCSSGGAGAGYQFATKTSQAVPGFSLPAAQS